MMRQSFYFVRSTFQALSSSCKHPLILAVMAALFSSYFLPVLVKQSQDQAQAHQIRSQIAKDAISISTEMILAIQFAEHSSGTTAEAYDASYMKWEAQSASIYIQLQAFFRDPQLAEDWKTYSNAISSLYALSGSYTEPYRSQRIRILRSAFVVPEDDWKVISQYRRQKANGQAFESFFKSWFVLRESALTRASAFSTRLLRAEVRLDGDK